MINHSPIILDIAGTTLTKIDVERLMHPLTGGVILFSRNWESRAQLHALCLHIKHRLRGNEPHRRRAVLPYFKSVVCAV